MSIILGENTIFFSGPPQFPKLFKRKIIMISVSRNHRFRFVGFIWISVGSRREIRECRCNWQVSSRNKKPLQTTDLSGDKHRSTTCWTERKLFFYHFNKLLLNFFPLARWMEFRVNHSTKRGVWWTIKEINISFSWGHINIINEEKGKKHTNKPNRQHSDSDIFKLWLNTKRPEWPENYV
jgi:hypothetical protein